MCGTLCRLSVCDPEIRKDQLLPCRAQTSHTERLTAHLRVRSSERDKNYPRVTSSHETVNSWIFRHATGDLGFALSPRHPRGRVGERRWRIGARKYRLLAAFLRVDNALTLLVAFASCNRRLRTPVPPSSRRYLIRRSFVTLKLRCVPFHSFTVSCTYRQGRLDGRRDELESAT